MTTADQLLAMFPNAPVRLIQLLIRVTFDCGVPAYRFRAMDDIELLSLPGFGDKSLTEFRAVCPEPIIDGWHEHALMVAGSTR